MGGATASPAAVEDEEMTEALEKLADRIKVGDPADAPDDYVRAVHLAWKRAGGALAGKPRHSDRVLSENLTRLKTPVRSLTPKLAGKTRIRGHDASALLRYFLANWPAPGGDTSGEAEIEYRPLLDDEEIDGVAELVASMLDSDEQVSGATLQGDDEALPGRPFAEFTIELLEDSAGSIIVSPENTVILASPKTELIGFRGIINRFWGAERADGRARVLGWVVDIGRRSFDDENARTVYRNVQNLMVRFKALRDFDDRNAAERWDWLRSRAFIVVLDSRYDEGVPLPRVRRPLFVAHHVSFTAVAPAWLALPEFRGLYGSNLERLGDRNFSVFPQEDGTFRYLGHATFYKGPREKGDHQLRSIELPSPGANYDDALRTVTYAGAHILNLKPFDDQNPAEASEAVEKLRYLGYRILRLDDFLKDY